MFDLIGAGIAIGIFFALSFALGLLFALAAFLLLLGRPLRRNRLVFGAALLPLAAAVHMLFWELLISTFAPPQTGGFFGDISEPLPNGYRLSALGKMHDYATIEAPPGKDSHLGPDPVGFIAQSGSIVVGRYHPFAASGEAGDPYTTYFALDTHANTVQTFNTQPDLENSLGTSVTLMDPASFRSNDPGHLRLLRVEHAIQFGPPLILSVFYFGWLLRRRFHRQT